MNIVDAAQGSVEWVAARIGLPSASQFKRLITEKTHKPAAAADAYMDEILAEWLIGAPLETDASAFMERGSANESKAIAWYEATRDCEVQRVGFCVEDDGRWGCSPDGLIPEKRRGLECKNLGPAKHVGYLRAVAQGVQPTEFYAQVQGGLLVTGYDTWDLLLYEDLMPEVCIRYTRDDIYLTKLRAILERFVMGLTEAKEALIRAGYHPPDDGVSSWLKRALEASLAAT